MIRFEVSGKPVPKMRPRVTRNGTYTPRKTLSYEGSIGWAARACTGLKTQMTGMCEVRIEFYDTRADIDNLIKSVLDGMNGIVYHDDRQVVKVTAEKKKGEAKTIVEVEEIPSPDS